MRSGRTGRTGNRGQRGSTRLAADVDERERYPSEARDALVKAGFHAVHVPEEYEGQGADAVAA
ncbi:acyl-CoA dehydrogenase family protein, partial [Amycolatopsis acidiphila]